MFKNLSHLGTADIKGAVILSSKERLKRACVKVDIL